MHMALYQDTTFTDVVIKCNDGIELKAHKAVLAISSEYFKTIFTGNCTKASSCYIEADVPSSIMQKFLALLYTGKMLKYNQSTCIRLWELAAYYQVPELIVSMGNKCVRRTTVDNITNLLVLADKFPEHKLLNLGCFRFIKLKAVALLGNPDIIEFAGSHPAFWVKVRAFLDSK